MTTEYVPRGSELTDTTWLFSPECSVADPRA
jgi:hypothetical protein